MAAQDHELLAGGGVPQPGGVVIGRGEHARAVGREHGRGDPILMAAQDPQLLARGGVPQPGGLVPGRGEHARPSGENTAE